MENDANQRPSLWTQDSAPPESVHLNANLNADVCVVGAGITGMTSAYLLSEEGLNVVVIEDGAIGGGETGRTTAHLTNAMDDRFVALEEMHGADKTRLVAESHAAAIDRIEQICASERIDCEFLRLDGYLFTPPEDDGELLDDELAAAHRAGLDAVTMANRAPFDGFDTGRALRFPNQAQFHPMKYLGGLFRAFIRNGGRIYTRTHVTEVIGGRHACVRAGDWKVETNAIVVATNAPIVSRVAIASRQAAYRTYVIGARTPSDSVHQALYWDTADPYHYVRIQKGPREDFILIGGEDHKTGQNEDSANRYRRLESWARERFRSITSFDYCWSGQVMEPADGLAFIGRNPLDEPNVFIATGDSGQGMTHGTIAGILLTDLINGRSNPWTELYDPSRINIRAFGKVAQENLNAAAQYGSWVTGGDVDSVDLIPRESGGILRRGLRKIAVYKDAGGVVHERSAVCPHMGCLVHWNGGEKTWDCPCHGSRFGRLGDVINGPANRGLATEPAEEERGPDRRLA